MSCAVAKDCAVHFVGLITTTRWPPAAAWAHSHTIWHTNRLKTKSFADPAYKSALNCYGHLLLIIKLPRRFFGIRIYT